MTDATAAPLGAPLGAFIEGILDGRVGDGAKLAEAVRVLGQAGAGPFRLDVQGGRFSLLPVETQIASAAFDDAAQTAFLHALHGVLAAAAPGTVEANLRCRLVYAQEVAETLFVIRGAAVEPLTRRRPRRPEDDAGLLATTLPQPLGLRRRELLVLAPVLLVLGLLVAWQTGWIDRVLAARAEGLTREAGPFGAMLDVQVERTWGNYRVRLRRGADYPATPADVAQKKAAAADHTHASACDIVGDGRDLFVQLLDGDHKVLAEERADLRPLLASAEAEVVTKLPGRIGARTVRLSIHQAPRPQ